ncbi:MAG TPA: hypothetical protein VJY34_28460 [Roseiarcus sp.]|nr:hypothetical protein [Roseiarcus sp.]
MEQTINLSIRVPPDTRSWLQIASDARRVSLNTVICEALSRAMQEQPNYVVVRRCASRRGKFFTCAWNESKGDFYTGKIGEGEEEAFAAVEAEIKKRGFKLRDVSIEHRSQSLDRGPRPEDGEAA